MAIEAAVREEYEDCPEEKRTDARDLKHAIANSCDQWKSPIEYDLSEAPSPRSKRKKSEDEFFSPSIYPHTTLLFFSLYLCHNHLCVLFSHISLFLSLSLPLFPPLVMEPERDIGAMARRAQEQSVRVHQGAAGALAGERLLRPGSQLLAEARALRTKAAAAEAAANPQNA
jgi:hypothetical protein